MKKISLLLFLFFFCVTSAFASRLVEIKAVNQKIDKTVSQESVREAIVKACKSRKWIVQSDANGEIQAQVQERGHSLTVLIKYSNNEYTINYKDSSNLLYDAKKNLIHRNYNRWVENLKKDINANLHI